MMIFPAVHYTMGGLWVDYNLSTTVPGLYALGEANFSDHGANRLGASALMQGLADGYFVIPYTIGDYLAGMPQARVDPNSAPFKGAEAAVKERINKLLSIKGQRTVDDLHRELGQIMWDYCGMSRTAEGLTKAKGMIENVRKEFWNNLKLLGGQDELNQSLEKALRLIDFIELGYLMVEDALQRNESCGGHFREEYQHTDGECKRDDEKFGHAAAWEYQGPDKTPLRNAESLNYEFVKMSVRNYK
jgi:succinate dehydrogenase / fumarate reductase flavoprotein subunit